MAKGNLLLGTAGNSVGDVVMYRREGAQVSRVRVRKIKNPKTDAQSLQRAAFSPVAKFFSPLAVVLERSFEGLSKMKSYNKFLKTNIDLARANGWLLPKGTGFFPLPYQLSKGTLPIVNLTLDNNSSGFALPVNTQVTSIGDFSTAMIALGYKNGDVVTFILVQSDSQSFATANYTPIAVQIELDTDSTVEMTTALAMVKFNSSQGPSGYANTIGNADTAGAAVIIARFENDKWRRSTQSLELKPAVLTAISSADYKAAAIASYGMNAGDPNPLVYLDGDTLEG